MNKKVKFFKKSMYVLVMFVIFSITIGYAALGSEMSLSGVVGEIRIKKDIRVTGVSASGATSFGLVNSYEHSVSSILTNVTLPNSDSTVKFDVTVTNIGNAEMGIYEFTGLPSNLTYEVEGYTLKDKICDSNGDCVSGISKTFSLKVKYVSGGYNSSKTNYQLNIGVDFGQFYTITYKNMTNNNYPIEIIEGDTLDVTLVGSFDGLAVYMSGLKVDSNGYTFSNNRLILSNVTGNVTITPASSLDKVIRLNASLDTSINFGSAPSSTNGQGVYIRSGTENNANPIYYFRGDVDNNNVYFAGFCWKIVRTTETGGTKLVYNGKLKEVVESSPISQSEYTNVTNDATYPYTFDSSALTWTSTNKTDSKTGEISFSVASAGDYVLSYTVSSEANYDKAYFYLDGTQLGVYSGSVSGTLNLSGLTISSVIKVQYTKDSSSASGSDTVVFSLGKSTGNVTTSCANSGLDSQLASTSAFNSSYTSPADVGYMYGTRYEYGSTSLSSQSATYLYGNSFSWDGTNYTLKDTMSSSSWKSDYKTIATKYHYTCLNTTGVCSSIYYIHYFGSSSTPYYLTLTGGKDIETAKTEMFANTTDSKIKKAVDDWYAANMTSYTSKLENTIFCNDRSIAYGPLLGKDADSSSKTYSYFGAYDRNASSTKAPSVECPNKNDSFTLSVANGGTSGYGNNALKYPVGLLTADEYTLAGSGYSGYSASAYLNTGQYQWSLSPYNFVNTHASGFYVSSSGYLSDDRVSGERGVRPSVSLVPGTLYFGGDGSEDSPYIVE